MSWIRISFTRWRLLHSQQKILENKTNIKSLQVNNLDFQNQVIALSNTNTDVNEERTQ